MKGLNHLYVCFFFLIFFACKEKELQFDRDNGGLYLPDDFSALVVVDSLEGAARHLAVDDRGYIYVKLRSRNQQGGNAAIRDRDGDGRGDIVSYFGDYKYEGQYGTGMRIHRNYLYFSTELAVYRQKLDASLVPRTNIETILIDDHDHSLHEHIAKPIAFDGQGKLYVPFGAPSNCCQEPKRTPGKPGLDPCPQLENHGGIWVFDENKIEQTQSDGEKFATGIRSLVGLEWDHQTNALYAVMHGRDDLLRLFPARFSPWQSALLPSEEFLKIEKGSDFGWPYCYYDQLASQKVLCPEYGGDGVMVGRCDQYDDPIMGFPGHWAPNDLLFYTGDQFPERYKEGAFIAFHGSTNRAPYPQSGYFIAFVPFVDGAPNGSWEIFADGFAGVDPIENVSDAIYRPMGLAQGPDGSIYIAETEKGKIWRIVYQGVKENFGDEKLLAMEQRKQLSHIRTPDEKEDDLLKDIADQGERNYILYCATCHQRDGEGAGSRFPSLVRTDWVTGDKNRLIYLVLNGLEGPIEVNGKRYNTAMPQHQFLEDHEIAEILTFIRRSFGNQASPVEEEEVRLVRSQIPF